jgi:hypothetical protein
MDARVSRLLAALDQLHSGPPTDLLGFHKAQPDAGLLPSPWETWVPIGLVRHRHREPPEPTGPKPWWKFWGG